MKNKLALMKSGIAIRAESASDGFFEIICPAVKNIMDKTNTIPYFRWNPSIKGKIDMIILENNAIKGLVTNAEYRYAFSSKKKLKILK